MWLSCFGGCSFLRLLTRLSPFPFGMRRMETQPSVCILRVHHPHNKFVKITLLGDAVFAFRHFNALSWLSEQNTKKSGFCTLLRFYVSIKFTGLLKMTILQG